MPFLIFDFVFGRENLVLSKQIDKLPKLLIQCLTRKAHLNLCSLRDLFGPTPVIQPEKKQTQTTQTSDLNISENTHTDRQTEMNSILQLYVCIRTPEAVLNVLSGFVDRLQPLLG